MNVARGKAAYQSSVAYDGYAARSVDGNTNPDHNTGFCSHTAYFDWPWWMVDLGGQYSITSVVVYKSHTGTDLAYIYIIQCINNNSHYSLFCVYFRNVIMFYIRIL